MVIILVRIQLLILLALQARGSVHVEIKGRPKFGKTEEQSKLSTSKQKCWNFFCSDPQKTHCVVSFGKYRCSHFTIWPQMLVWNENDLFEKKNVYITLFRKTAPFVPPPQILWLFDNVFQGKNLGKAGGALDMLVAPPLEITDPGPRPKSSRKYVTYDPSKSTLKKAKYYVKILQDRKLLIDFTKAFTILTWLKTMTTGALPIIESYDPHNTAAGKGIDLWFWKDIDQLTFTGNGGKYVDAKTTKNFENNFDWRHIAVTYTGTPGSINFFLNGKTWPIKKSFTSTNVNPEYLILWHVYDDAFAGSFACMSIFQHSLSVREIQAVMNGCP